jgi:hypothetical protein
MARPRKQAVASNPLLEALRFLSLVTKDIGSANETHVILANGQAQAFNGVIAASHPIQEQLFACPHNTTLINALSKCSANYSITQFDHSKLQIKSDKFKAFVPCLDVTLLQNTIPDQPIAEINDTFKIAIDSVGTLVNENAQNVVTASILMNGQSVIATDRTVMFEYWHGINLPNNIALPKAIIAPLTKTTKKLSKFGFSLSSATFYFEDESWIKTQLYAEKWPDVSSILDKPSNPLPIPKELWTAIEAVAPFSADGLLSTRDGCLFSGPTDNAGASFECSGLPNGLTFSVKQMTLIKPWATAIDFFSQGVIMAFGNRIRGVIAGRT